MLGNVLTWQKFIKNKQVSEGWRTTNWGKCCKGKIKCFLGTKTPRKDSWYDIQHAKQPICLLLNHFYKNFSTWFIGQFFFSKETGCSFYNVNQWITSYPMIYTVMYSTDRSLTTSLEIIPLTKLRENSILQSLGTCYIRKHLLFKYRHVNFHIPSNLKEFSINIKNS